jgi:hypothetical protein
MFPTLLACCLALAGPTPQAGPPPGWRYPTAPDYRGLWAAYGGTPPAYPRPTNGILVAITVMKRTFASSGRPAM